MIELQGALRFNGGGERPRPACSPCATLRCASAVLRLRSCLPGSTHWRPRAALIVFAPPVAAAAGHPSGPCQPQRAFQGAARALRIFAHALVMACMLRCRPPEPLDVLEDAVPSQGRPDGSVCGCVRRPACSGTAPLCPLPASCLPSATDSSRVFLSCGGQSEPQQRHSGAGGRGWCRRRAACAALPTVAAP